MILRRVKVALMFDRRAVAKIGVCVFLAFFFAGIGPFGEYQNESLVTRLQNWILDVAVGAIVFVSCQAWLKNMLWAHTQRVPMSTLGGALLGAIPMLGFMNLTEFLAGRDPLTTIPDLVLSYGQTVMIALLFLSIFNLIDISLRRDNHRDAGFSSSKSRLANRFMKRVSESLGEELVSLEMEDHYVRVNTRVGSELIHMRLGDAITELGERSGFQPHRSWWVKAEAVHEVKKSGRNLQLILVDGTIVPVARRRVSELKKSGWLD